MLNYFHHLSCAVSKLRSSGLTFSPFRLAMLCSDCEKVFSVDGNPFINYHEDKRWGSSLGGTMHKNFTSLAEAAKERCQICEPLWKRIMAKRPADYTEPENGMGTLTILSFEHSTSVFSPGVLQIRHRRFGGGPHVFPEEEAQLVLLPLIGESLFSGLDCMMLIIITQRRTKSICLKLWTKLGGRIMMDAVFMT
jgi:hypothetical protein